ncbi:MAG TPA: 4-hydroxythreonine-4-phosphate dehydrogenase PdxA [Herbaspirillum sp.]
MTEQAATQKGPRPILAVTCGEPAGIGPEIALRAAWAMREQADCVLIGDAALLRQTAAALNAALGTAIALDAIALEAWRQDGAAMPTDSSRLAVLDCPLAAPAVAGQLDPRNGMAVLQTLDVAIQGTLASCFDAIVTAPLQKSTINDAGVAFTGHTEYLAEQTGTSQVVMMLAGAPPSSSGSSLTYLRVALATTHLPLKDVPAAISQEGLAVTLDILQRDLRQKFGLAQPRILVTGLNPHAGESGYLGSEEQDVIEPAIKAAQARGIDARGPYPADTLFQDKYLQDADCVLAMYHDQGLPVLKFATFGNGINVTLGLPLIRTSVDHGTALDLAAAGVGRADHQSMIAAIEAAVAMVAASKTVGEDPAAQ